MFFLLSDLQDFFTDHAADPGNVGIRNKLKLGKAQAGKPEFQLAVQVKCAGGFNRESLNLEEA